MPKFVTLLLECQHPDESQRDFEQRLGYRHGIIGYWRKRPPKNRRILTLLVSKLGLEGKRAEWLVEAATGVPSAMRPSGNFWLRLSWYMIEGETLEEFAFRLGFPPSRLCVWQSGGAANPLEMQQIADRLELSRSDAWRVYSGQETDPDDVLH